MINTFKFLVGFYENTNQISHCFLGNENSKVLYFFFLKGSGTCLQPIEHERLHSCALYESLAWLFEWPKQIVICTYPQPLVSFQNGMYLFLFEESRIYPHSLNSTHSRPSITLVGFISKTSCSRHRFYFPWECFARTELKLNGYELHIILYLDIAGPTTMKFHPRNSRRERLRALASSPHYNALRKHT